MKLHTSDFKNEIKEFGREIDSIITYELNGETIELGDENLNSVTPHYKGAILKSIMKQLDFDSNVEIPIGTIVNYQFGVKIRNENVEDYKDNYDYINFGNYIVKDIERKEDTNSYLIKCCDKMLYSMVDYERLGEYSLTEDTIFQENKNYYNYADNVYTLYTGNREGNPTTIGLYEYIFEPTTIDDYIKTICDHLGLTFKNYEETYANSTQVINDEFYIANDGTSLNFTFRDVFDDLAEVTASTIVINEEDDELEIRYINETNDTIDAEYLKDINVDFGQKYGPINSIVLSRSAESDNIYLQDDESIEENGLCELKITDNEIMNLNDRERFLPDILEKLDGLEFYLNDYSSIGIAYYNICDKYNISITTHDEESENDTNVIYPCIMLNDEFSITQGNLEELIYTEQPEQTETEYKYAETTDKKINKAYLIVKKNESEIEGLVSSMGEFDETIDQVVQNITGLTNNFIKNGGTNLFYNTGLHFKDDNDNFTYWIVEPQDPSTDYLGVVNDSESLSGTNMILPRGKIRQTINITPGTYSFSFSYRQNLATATGSVTINNKTIQLESNTEWTQIDFEEQQIEVINNTLTIEFECNVQGGYYIKELMLNRGTESMEYAQNINETRTDTVQISDGILVTSSSTNTESRHDSDGFRILRKDNKEVVLRATENGTETTSIKASSDSEIAGLLIKKYQGHVLMSSKGDD